MIVSLQEIDDYIVQAKERSYETMVNFGKQGLSIAATAAVSAAVKASFFLFFFLSFYFFFGLLCIAPHSHTSFVLRPFNHTSMAARFSSLLWYLSNGDMPSKARFLPGRICFHELSPALALDTTAPPSCWRQQSN